jgi:hypothetical protein
MAVQRRFGAGKNDGGVIPLSNEILNLGSLFGD